MKISNEELSKQKKHVHELIEIISRVAFECVRTEPLIQGVPGEVFRRCGKANCACADNKEKRHGPYLVVQIYNNKKQQQMSVRKEKKYLWEAAKHYQEQQEKLHRFKKASEALYRYLETLIDKRVEPWS